MTKLHRNTVSSRLKHLVSEGLVTKAREKHRVQYAIVEPIDVIKWTEISWDTYKEIGKRRLMRVIREWWNTETVSGLTKLENLPENKDLLDSQELFEGFPEWEKLSPEEYFSMLKINHDLTEKAICPNCFHKDPVEDHSTDEIACPNCGYVIEDETISLKKRAEAISFLLKKTLEEGQAKVTPNKEENADDRRDRT